MCCSCVPGWKSVDGRGYNIFLLTLGFFVPLLLIVSSSLSKYRYLKQVSVPFIAVNETSRSPVDR